jgi:UDP-N-acetylglucosamine--N-acetylmuramyl-(pentapeptide) pyrophosphoryl-undecaprenol N-acetylglucosamine transferase
VVVFSGGGTGGHLYPALAIADALRAQRSDVRAVFVGATRGLEARILPERGEDHHLLPVRGIDRARLASSWRVVPALCSSLYSVAQLFRRLRPEAVVVTGGYAGTPAGLVAGMLGVPLLLQEQNSVPGLATRALSRFADIIHVAFPEAIERLPRSVRDRVRQSGNPVRAASPRSRAEARSLFALPADALVGLVTGGSQGSLALNEFILQAIEGVVANGLSRPQRLQLLWSAGSKHHDVVAARLARLGDPPWVHVLPYIEDMPSALAAADLAVTRSGAMTTSELLNQGLPAVLVPLPTAAANHQAHNAMALAQAGAAVVVSQPHLTGELLWAEVVRLAEDEATLADMRAAALSRARPDAASEIAADVERLLATRAGVG